MDNFLYEKIYLHPDFKECLVNNIDISFIQMSYRVKNNNDGILLLLLNLCILEKLSNSNYKYLSQKKNIRAFAPLKSIIGSSFILNKKNPFINDFFYFYKSDKNFVLYLKKEEINPESLFINNVHIHFSLGGYLHYSNIKLHYNDWETFSYFYDPLTYGLDVSLFFNTRYYFFIKLLLSIKGFYYIEE